MRGPPGSSAQCLGTTHPRHPRPWSCLHCPRPAHLLGYRWRSTRWTQLWRLHLGPTLSPGIKGSVGDLSDAEVQITLMLCIPLKRFRPNRLSPCLSVKLLDSSWGATLEDLDPGMNFLFLQSAYSPQWGKLVNSVTLLYFGALLFSLIFLRGLTV